MPFGAPHGRTSPSQHLGSTEAGAIGSAPLKRTSCPPVLCPAGRAPGPRAEPVRVAPRKPGSQHLSGRSRSAPGYVGLGLRSRLAPAASPSEAAGACRGTRRTISSFHPTSFPLDPSDSAFGRASPPPGNLTTRRKDLAPHGRLFSMPRAYRSHPSFLPAPLVSGDSTQLWPLCLGPCPRSLTNHLSQVSPSSDDLPNRGRLSLSLKYVPAGSEGE